MPRTQSAKKALRQNVRRHARNVEQMKTLKSTVKDFRRLVVAGKLDEAKQQLSKVFKILDKTAKVGLIKQGNARRVKSRLSKSLAKKK